MLLVSLKNGRIEGTYANKPLDRLIVNSQISSRKEGDCYAKVYQPTVAVNQVTVLKREGKCDIHRATSARVSFSFTDEEELRNVWASLKVHVDDLLANQPYTFLGVPPDVTKIEVQ